MANPVREREHSLTTLGGTLFKLRSYTLVPVAVALLVLPWFVAGDPIWAYPWMTALGIGFLLLGAGVRFHVNGRSPRGTSTRGKTIGAAQLVTSGFYGHTRNPLYVANSLLWLCAACLTGIPYLVVPVLLILMLQYHVIVLAEEEYLREKFGEEFDTFCRNVPRFLPRLTSWKDRGEPLPFTWKRAVFKEHDSLYGALAIATAVLTPALLRTEPTTEMLAAWFGGFAVLTLVWLVVKGLKRRDSKARRNPALDRAAAAAPVSPMARV